MIQTKNTQPLKARKEIVDLFNGLLADATDLRSQAKQAHWNVKGDNFIALHLLFDEIATALLPLQDEIAERAVQLGGEVKGTLRQAASATSLPEYLQGAADSSAHVDALSSALAAFGTSLREGIEACDKAEDMASQDILIEAQRVVDKYVWFVEAHQQNAPAQRKPRTQQAAANGKTAGKTRTMRA
jgi:starvation-inducible DNA-binding protein